MARPQTKPAPCVDKTARDGWLEVMHVDWHDSPAGWLLKMQKIARFGDSPAQGMKKHNG
jgi:hypothetical protein